jgi:predicted O-linked N-acetylglucosamine transferase (SPINDLY family)
VTIQQSFDLAVQFHQAGKLREAESIYRQILAHQPNHADALHLLGVVALQSGQHRVAVDLIGRALAIQPAEAAYHNNQGNAWMNLGNLDVAAASFRQACAFRPAYAEAHYNLGLVFQKQGLAAEAVAEYRTALQLKPDYPDAWQNLGTLLLEQGSLAAATSAFREALRLRPLEPEIHYRLGNSLLDQAAFSEAAAAYQEAIRLRPDFAEAHYNLGIALHRQDRIAAAKAAYQTALQFRPDYPAAHGNLGKALLDEGEVDAAIEAFRAALQIQPDHADSHYNLGNAWLRQGQREAAANAYRAALRCNPHFIEAWVNLGNLLQEHDQLDEAVAAYQNALAIRPESADAFDHWGTALKDRGELDSALDHYRRAMALLPGKAAYHSHLVYLLHFHPGFGAKQIREELAKWNERHARPLGISIPRHSNPREPSRRLKVGYVSTDFRQHVIGRNLLPLFRHHDHAQFEIFCYASLPDSDALTSEFQKCADQWRDVARLSDEDLAAQIREDGVDVLVDLSQHLAHHRLLAFARRPAPVQVSFAGYPGGTGVEAIEYRISDRWLEGNAERGVRDVELEGLAIPHSALRIPHSDRVCLLDSFWCFDPLEEHLEINELPAVRTGYVTFGCLNNFCKINGPLIALWTRILAEVSESRLRLLAPRGQCREAFLASLEARGIDRKRVEFMTKAPRSQYLTGYHGIDLVLDTFPYNGHSTSLDALWMGVPVVSLAGEHPVSRAGLSQMSNLGMPDLVTSSPDEYVRISVELARDLPRLAELRRTLRPRMEASILMDAPRFTRNIEAAYRRMWQRWCESQI